ncbi:dipeptidase [Pusillimonas sp.]|uniref:dipeptidase n=1 Tax=Pusillimonas sp. TaxID=3040095 RepID=UPI0029AC674F|nr:membrane dipeptidase [Pusillimonas sp.]MDX3895015.1 membrane dipeptidase [Pusillimonas sp.]
MKISEASAARARALHASSFTYDFVPMASPFIRTARHDAVMDAELARQAPLGRVLRAMMTDRLEEFRSDAEYRKRHAGVWEASGIKTIQVTLGGIEVDPCSWDALLRDVAWYSHAERVAGMLRVCRSADELEAAAREGVLGVLLGTQDAGWMDPPMERLQLLHHAGTRVLQLTYNERNRLADGCSEPADGGLSRFGKSVIARCNELGIAVDVSHTGYRSSLEAMEVSSDPVAVTHSACRALNAHPRAKPDDVLRSVRDTGGFFGIVAVPAFLASDGRATLDDMLDHVEHAANIAGPEHVGIATDWGAVTPDTPPPLMEATRQAFIRAGFAPDEVPEIGRGLPEFSDWRDWRNITAGLFERGFDEGQVRQLIGGNWLDYMRRCGL